MARRKFEPGRNGESRIVEIPSSTNGVCENKLFYAHRLKELLNLLYAERGGHRLHLDLFVLFKMNGL